MVMNEVVEPYINERICYTLHECRKIFTVGVDNELQLSELFVNSTKYNASPLHHRAATISR